MKDQDGEMADMFYFNSPRKPLYSKYRPRSRVKPKFTKRYCGKVMETSHRACVAQLEEPTFCSNDISAILPHWPISSLLPLPVSGDRRSFASAENEVDEDGGVPVDEPAEATTDRYGAPPRVPDNRSPAATRSTQREHPRPVSRDIWEEEDGRRLRLALADDDHDRELFQRLTQTTRPLSRSDDYTPGVTENLLRDSRDQVNAGPDFSNGGWSTEREYVGTPATGGPSPVTTESASTVAEILGRHFSSIVNSTMDEEALPVDDPRRSYDFANFMDDWRLRWLTGKQQPAFEPGLQPSVRIGRPSTDVTPTEMREKHLDMQGLRWHLIGPDREAALDARATMHSSRCDRYPQRRSVSPEQRTKNHYRFKRYIPRHRAHFAHYQLRNVLAATSRNDIFYSTGNEVIQTSLACPSVGHPIIDLSKHPSHPCGVRITCLAASPRRDYTSYRSDNVVFVGGFNGEYALLDTNSEASRSHSAGFVTHAYNGVVTHIDSHYDRRSGLLQAAFCSNDRRVRTMDVETLCFTNDFTYDTAINCSAISSDGRLRALVGDSQECLVTDAERGNSLVTLQEHDDHGFACAWSPDGRNLATGAQDGKVVIWDARNWSKPVQFLQCLMSSARSVQFADHEALVIAEDDDVVSIYDTRDFSARQDIRFFGSIAGVALLDGGDEIVVANADRTVGGLLSFQRTSYGEPLHRNRGARLRRCPDDVSDIFV
ncbi:hypothetical protein LTR37_003467 [Vermiconidia calcicola]|uniref:Uncharacterized protein n=1 Tax=Vermiconidia calcicola TaxID=1690605 RepID=A0ACC3NPH7_9PEZI|nr:hypothetical protein LTR37_003467 [Vermiconidia calcicola]